MSLAGIVIVWGLLCVCAPRAQAVTILEKDKDTPTRGFFVAQNEFSVTILEVLPGGATNERVIVRSQIEEIFLAVDNQRLTNLKPENPRAYREYAEELRERREDPDARATAIRLYLIAAYLDPIALGKSSLLGMTALARSPDEEKRFRALAYLLDQEHDRTVLTTPAPSASGLALSNSDRNSLRILLRNLRTGEMDNAKRMLERDYVRAIVIRMAPLLDLPELENAASTNATLPNATLRRVLNVELMLLPALPSPRTADERSEPTAWSTIIAHGKTNPLPTLTLETVADFDPRLHYFHEGKWVADAPSGD